MFRIHTVLLALPGWQFLMLKNNMSWTLHAQRLRNCSRKWEMTNIIFMEVTPPVIVQNTIHVSFYLNAVGLEVLKNGTIKEGEKRTSQKPSWEILHWENKNNLNTAILATNYELYILFFFPVGDSLFFSFSHPFCIDPSGPKSVLSCLSAFTGFQHTLKVFHFCQLQWKPFLETFALLEGES